MFNPARAPVRPRVILPETNESIPLEDVLREFRGRPGEFLIIVGGIGSGKSVALSHLASCVDDNFNIAFLDVPSPAAAYAATVVGAVVVTTREPWPDLSKIGARSYTLAPWTNDDLIEYLLARHPPQCASVMKRVVAAADRVMHHGRPELCCAVLERMAEDEGLLTVAEALRRAAHETLVTPENVQLARLFCISSLARAVMTADETLRRLRTSLGDNSAFRLLRHEPVQLLLATDGLVAMLESPRKCPWLNRQLPRPLVKATGPLLSATAIAHLRQESLGSNESRHAMAASLLHAIGRGWIPADKKSCNLSGAYLDGSYWAALRLKGLNLHKCDLSDSNLRGIVLEEACASQANFARSLMSDAALDKFQARWAEFQDADMSSIKADFADFEGANFTGADLFGAHLHGAVLRRAVLRGARFDGADLRMSNLRGANIDGASFADVDFEQADLTELPLKSANIQGAQFPYARMSMCDLEEADVPAANFAWADMMGANFTSARMPGANFSHAILEGAKLADVIFEGADLTHANLSGCTFHFGSSRCGHVGSPLASEGSRTGFYTDEYEQQFYRPPEEIRTANLWGVDLTGADLTDTDFYLVDLRRAKYTSEQFEHLRRCGAILFDRE